MRRNVSILAITLAFLLAACSPSETPQGEVTVVPTNETLEGAVEISFPMSGAIIYAETIFLQGTASDIPEEGFQIQLVAPDDSIIAEASVQPDENGNWSVDLVHQYTGDPTEVTVLAKPSDPNSALDYDIESILLSTMENRPEGVFGSILNPTDGMQVGGDFILVSGRGSGLFENTFGLVLENAEGETITEIPVTLNNPNFIDDILWEAEIPRNEFIGNGTIHMVYQDMESGDMVTLDSVNVVVTAVAG